MRKLMGLAVLVILLGCSTGCGLVAGGAWGYYSLKKGEQQEREGEAQLNALTQAAEQQKAKARNASSH